MPVFVADDRRVLFIHVPKTGGTTVERMFRASGWRMRFHATKNSEPEVRPLRRCTPQHFHGALLAEMFALHRFDFRFLVVRHPIARFRSEYLHRARKHGRPALDAGSVGAWADGAFRRYRDNPYVHDNHLRPQVEFVVPDTEVYRIEDGMDHITGAVGRRLGTPLHRDVEHGQVNATMAGVPSSAVEISPALEERLRAFYAEDFATFGY